jgi:hypothetical protein
MDCDDFFGDDDVENDDATTRKVTSKLLNDGYRVGKGIEEAAQMQIGFDMGFEQGMLTGRLCGQLYASCRKFSSTVAGEHAIVIKELEELLFVRISETGFIDDATICSIRILVLSISPELQSALELFEREVNLLNASLVTEESLANK